MKRIRLWGTRGERAACGGGRAMPDVKAPSSNRRSIGLIRAIRIIVFFPSVLDAGPARDQRGALPRRRPNRLMYSQSE